MNAPVPIRGAQVMLPAGSRPSAPAENPAVRYERVYEAGGQGPRHATSIAISNSVVALIKFVLAPTAAAWFGIPALYGSVFAPAMESRQHYATETRAQEAKIAERKICLSFEKERQRKSCFRDIQG